MEPTAASTSSTSSAGAARVAVGRVVGAHGLSGQLRLHCFTDSPEALLALDSLWLGGPEPAAGDPCYRVEACAPGRAGELRLTLAGVVGRRAAEGLVGRTAHVRVADLPPAEDGELYGFELVGFRAETAEGRLLGRVTGIWSTGPSPLLVIEAEPGGEHLVPAALLVSVDRAARKLAVDAIPGLIDGPA